MKFLLSILQIVSIVGKKLPIGKNWGYDVGRNSNQQKVKPTAFCTCLKGLKKSDCPQRKKMKTKRRHSYCLFKSVVFACHNVTLSHILPAFNNP